MRASIIQQAATASGFLTFWRCSWFLEFFSLSSQFSGHNFASGSVSAAMRILLSLSLSILNNSLHTKFVLSTSSSRDVTELWSFLKRIFFFFLPLYRIQQNKGRNNPERVNIGVLSFGRQKGWRGNGMGP